MDTQSQQNISSTFTAKSDAILSNTMKKYNIEESLEKIIEKVTKGISDNTFILTKLTMYFSRKEISEKEFVSSMQKEINVSQQVAEQVAKEIINNIIPTLGEKPEERKEANAPPKIQTSVSVTELSRQNTPIPKKESTRGTTKRIERVKKPIILGENEGPTQKPKIQKGPDNYREPIE